MINFVWVILSCASLSVYEARKATVPPPVPQIDIQASEAEKRGGRLYRVAGCVGCHSPPFPEAKHLGGDRDLPTVFGRFYAPNISPDPIDGIGDWTKEDFFRAMRKGKSPKNKPYWPTFPYMAYTKMSDQDINDLWAYLRSQKPVKGKTKPKELNPNYKIPGLIKIWRWMEFKQGEYVPDPNLNEQENRGRYLSQSVAYCDQCHTPRNRLGRLVKKYYMAGGSNPGKSEVHPNLTTHKEKGIGLWSSSDIVTFLSTGAKPNGDMADHNQIMAEKIEDSYSYFSEEDKIAIAAYLKSLKPIDFDPQHFQP